MVWYAFVTWCKRNYLTGRRPWSRIRATFSTDQKWEGAGHFQLVSVRTLQIIRRTSKYFRNFFITLQESCYFTETKRKIGRHKRLSISVNTIYDGLWDKNSLRNYRPNLDLILVYIYCPFKISRHVCIKLIEMINERWRTIK